MPRQGQRDPRLTRQGRRRVQTRRGSVLEIREQRVRKTKEALPSHSEKGLIYYIEPSHRAEPSPLFAPSSSPGLQEYIEGVSFLYFLEHDGALVPLSYLQQSLSDPESGKPFFPVTPSDYILGLSDLTGELMRYTLNAIGLGKHEEALKTVGFVRDMKARESSFLEGPVVRSLILPPSVSYLSDPSTLPHSVPPIIKEFDPLISLLPGLHKKQEITNQSLQKIEDAAYQVALRRQEFAGREDVLGEMVKRGLADAGGGGAEDGGGKRARIE